MKNLLLTCVLTIILGIASSSAYAKACEAGATNGMGSAGGYGQTACVLPNRDTIFVPWFVCEMKDGKTNDF